jgi:hypothetical protein
MDETFAEEGEAKAPLDSEEDRGFDRVLSSSRSTKLIYDFRFEFEVEEKLTSFDSVDPFFERVVETLSNAKSSRLGILNRTLSSHDENRKSESEMK